MKSAIVNCEEVRELMPDLAAGLSETTPRMEEHLRACTECSGKLEEFRQTMALLDEWQAPEPSPYFDVRLQARLREEIAKQPTGWLAWVRKPVLALAFAVLMMASVTLVQFHGNPDKPTTTASAVIEQGSAVGDLQALDSNQGMYSDFDVLDDLQVQQDVTATP
jgi:predicted anti-sigma-YlaC factor YlaD